MNAHRTGKQFVLGGIALMCCLLQAACTKDKPYGPTEDSHRFAWSPSTGMRLVAVRGGTFAMGSPLDEPERENNETQHEVTLTRPYYLGVYEVTQGEFTHVMGFNPSTARGSERLPVETAN